MLGTGSIARPARYSARQARADLTRRPEVRRPVVFLRLWSNIFGCHTAPVGRRGAVAKAPVAFSQCSSFWTLPMTEWYLVWVEGLRGREPQKWSSDGLWGQLGRQDIIVRFPLTDQEAKLSLDQLAKLHPVPLE